MTEPPRYHRVVLKLSGEALLGTRQYGVDPAVCHFIAQQVQEAQSAGVEIAIVVGGGNIFRGLAAAARGMERATGDYMGMLATVMNGLALQDALDLLSCNEGMDRLQQRQIQDSAEHSTCLQEGNRIGR